MDLSGVTYIGPELDGSANLDHLPSNLGALLEQINGFILYGGALHVRGLCQSPRWHSLEEVWHGKDAFHLLYPSVAAHWVPFAEDCVGDQFFLSDGTILRLEAETGAVHATNLTLKQFLAAVEADPVATLSAEPLIQFRKEKGDLPEGQLILAYPPFCAKESADGVSLTAMDCTKVHRFHADLERQLPQDGSLVRVL
ncbi:SMI1/KNR4 family protein [Neogemmobacter tilapiae]|uniref:Uncharacterized protein n=1 Tax=Neogemmobacter tilapiae TaxID=875041 RepID=A0A918TLN4_9RHOB|nr:SMI1/KNR4 family protein [Gemmobacter tilapiae]GHC52423.1 hypothetical protein GCM10007315_13630 [Gemmobacter tilapiae]